jgi:hypothetical protein
LQSNGIVKVEEFGLEMIVNVTRVEVDEEVLYLYMGNSKVGVQTRAKLYGIQFGPNANDHEIAGVADVVVLAAGIDVAASVDPGGIFVAVVEGNEIEIGVDKPNVPKGEGSQSMADVVI